MNKNDWMIIGGLALVAIGLGLIHMGLLVFAGGALVVLLAVIDEEHP